MEFPTATPSLSLPDSAPRETAPPWEPPTLRAVCLDIDDTLVDFTAASRAALAALIGRPDMWPLWERVTEAHVAMVVRGELAYETMHHRRTASFLAELGVLAEHADVTEFERKRRALAEAGWGLFTDVLPCLEWLVAAGVRIAAVTNASGRHQRRKLADLGLAGYFDYVAVAGELGTAKPDPVIFDMACRELECLPSEAAHIGDKLETDARGARDAGMAGVWLSRTARGEGDGPEDPAPAGEAGVHVINTLEQLPELLVGEFVRVGAPIHG